MSAVHVLIYYETPLKVTNQFAMNVYEFTIYIIIRTKWQKRKPRATSAKCMQKKLLVLEEITGQGICERKLI